MTKVDKAKLADELKGYLLQEDYNYQVSDCNPVVFIDFMSYFRSQVFINEHPTFGDVMIETVARLQKQFKDVKMFHFIFDSYIRMSMKGPERISRSQKAKGVIHLARLEFNTPLPQQMDKFWGSEKNKRNLEESDFILYISLLSGGCITIVSSKSKM